MYTCEIRLSCREGMVATKPTGAGRGAAKDRAHDYVKRQVLTGAFPGGELISEGEVASALGMSRTPVREAFLRLQAEGLLRLYPKRGALVVPVSPAEINDVMETRGMIERLAVAKVFPSADHGEVGARLRDAVGQQRRLRKSAESFNEADRDFHGLLVA